MAPLRASTTKSEWLPDDPTAFVPTMLWKLPFITTWDGSRNQNHPTDSAEEARFFSFSVLFVSVSANDVFANSLQYRPPGVLLARGARAGKDTSHRRSGGRCICLTSRHLPVKLYVSVNTGSARAVYKDSHLHLSLFDLVCFRISRDFLLVM